MGKLKSCDQLRGEHELIAQVMGRLDGLIRRRRAGVEVSMLPMTGAIDFFAGFVARCHDTKEDEAFFPALAGRAADGKLIEALRREHEEGDELLGALRVLCSRQRVETSAWDVLENYLAGLRRHIATEEGHLFPLAEQLLSAEDDAAVAAAFCRIEDRTLGAAAARALVTLADAIADVPDAPVGPSPRHRGPSAREVMRPRPGTVGPDDTLARAAELMASLRIRELPVVAGRALVGILTRTDMEPHRGHYEWTAVRAAMTPNPLQVTPDTPVPAVADLLAAQGFNAVPVTDGETLLGIIARHDLLPVLAQRWGS